MKGQRAYDGQYCMLANTVVLANAVVLAMKVSPGLLAMKEAKTLLAHIDTPVKADIDTWLKAEIRRPSKANVVWENHYELVFKGLAVVCKDSDNELVFKDVADIEVHDWSFLDHLFTQEGTHIEEKYFHGFSDWRLRWKLCPI
ncbi:hypothetical protein CEK25_005947 [Fusarium fujikuroi]|nr:hypothetical protein CEK25_005947 [Fusarium fujikuroi]